MPYKGRKCLLSVVMIAKNEELNIARALESAVNCADEIIVVDTGSEDRTVEVARKYTDNVFFYKWQDNFSEVRNFAIKFAKCEWVLILDADEEISRGFAENIRSFLKELDDDVNTIKIPMVDFYDFTGNHKSIYSSHRIFRNGTFYYERPVHNQPIYKEKVVEFDNPIFHYGYITSLSLLEKKYKRSKPLIIKELRRSKEKIMYTYYLSQLFKIEYFARKYHVARFIGEKLVEYFFKYPPNDLPTIIVDVLIAMVQFYIEEKDFDRANRVLNKIIEVIPEHPDAYYMKAMCIWMYKGNDKYNDAKKILESFLDKYSIYLENPAKYDWSVNSVNWIQSAKILMALCEMLNGNLERYEKLINEALEENFTKYSCFAIEELFKVLTNEIRNEYYGAVVRNIEEFLYMLKMCNRIELAKRFVMRAIESGMKENLRIPENFEPTDTFFNFLRFVVNGDNSKNTKSEKYGLFEMVFFEKGYSKVVEEYGKEGILFVYDIMKHTVIKNGDYKKAIKILKNIEALNIDNENRALVNVLMGDIFLHLKNVNIAVKYYKEAFNMSKSMAKLLYEPLKEIFSASSAVVIKYKAFDYLKSKSLITKDFFIDINEIIPIDIQKILYAIFDDSLSFYISAIAYMEEGNYKKAVEIFRKISTNDVYDFPLYFYRLSQSYNMLGNFKDAKRWLIKALYENPSIADLKGNGKIEYRGIYPYKKLNFRGDYVMVVNSSEHFEMESFIDPVKIWKKAKEGFYVSEKVPYDFVIPYILEKYVDTAYFEIAYKVLAEVGVDCFKIALSNKIGKYFISNYVKHDIVNATMSEECSVALIVFPELLEDRYLKNERYDSVDRLIIIYKWSKSFHSKLWWSPSVYFLISPTYIRNLFKELNFEMEKTRSFNNEYCYSVFVKE